MRYIQITRNDCRSCIFSDTKKVLIVNLATKDVIDPEQTTCGRVRKLLDDPASVFYLIEDTDDD